jgi:elongator complex protein 3
MSSYHFEYDQYLDLLVPLLNELNQETKLTPQKVSRIIKGYPKPDGSVFAKDQILKAYRELDNIEKKPSVLALLRKKPMRTVSGVTPITVLTKPFPCPGKCIFCPNDIRMPKSYLSDEPGAQRAERNFFDPYLQTYNRLQALHNIGHTIEKAEIIVLGGTWSYYPESYQIWFIKECFRALNEFGSHDDRDAVIQRYEDMNLMLKKMEAHQLSSAPLENEHSLSHKKISGENIDKSYNQVISEIYTAPERIGGFDKYQSSTWDDLETQQKINETAKQRCVGLVIETRPDNISEQEVIRIRRLGCTKTQIGFQSLSDEVLAKNNRGHDVAASRRAVKLLRSAGFKIHAHWMANLYGSSVEEDKNDYAKIFNDPDFRPDELKVYPCSLIESAELMQYYKDGRWRPYSHEELLDVISNVLTTTPEYCRLTRIIRDIPSTDIVVGNKKTNFRQIAQQHIENLGTDMNDIRSREIRDAVVDESAMRLIEVPYETSIGKEIFIQFVVPGDGEPSKIVAFLRLSLPTEKAFIDELIDSALIREIHVYGRTTAISTRNDAQPQHSGLGTQLIERAKKIASEHGYKKMSVISAIGTKEYYRKKGFSDGALYQHIELN